MNSFLFHGSGGWNSRISVSNKFPGDAVATGPGITLQEFQCGSQIVRKYLK